MKKDISFLKQYIFIRIIIICWWQISHGKSSPIVTKLNNNIVSYSNPSWWWLTVGSKSVSAIGPIPYIIYIYRYIQWRLVVFINGGASKTIIEMSKSSIHRLPKFKGEVNRFLTKKCNLQQ